MSDEDEVQDGRIEQIVEQLIEFCDHDPELMAQVLEALQKAQRIIEGREVSDGE